MRLLESVSLIDECLIPLLLCHLPFKGESTKEKEGPTNSALLSKGISDEGLSSVFGAPIEGRGFTTKEGPY